MGVAKGVSLVHHVVWACIRLTALFLLRIADLLVSFCCPSLAMLVSRLPPA